MSDLSRAGGTLFNILKYYYKTHNCDETWVEWPSFQESNRGRAAARKGDLMKLALAASIGLNVAWACNGHGYAVPIQEWKGQLPKDVVAKRIHKRLGKSVCDQLEIKSHAEDAVGLGLYLKGFF